MHVHILICASDSQLDALVSRWETSKSRDSGDDEDKRRSRDALVSRSTPRLEATIRASGTPLRDQEEEVAAAIRKRLDKAMADVSDSDGLSEQEAKELVGYGFCLAHLGDGTGCTNDFSSCAPCLSSVCQTTALRKKIGELPTKMTSSHM